MLKSRTEISKSGAGSRRTARPLQALLALSLAAGAAVCAPAPGPALPDTPGGAKTVSFSILEDYDKGDDLAEVARDFDLFRELKVTIWRGSFGWDDYEPEPGKYDLAWLHSFIRLAEERNLTLRPYIGYTPEWAAGGKDADGQAWNQPPRDQQAWSAFVKVLVEEMRHHRNVRSLEIYNEQNVRQWWEGTADEYAVTLRSAAAVTSGLERLMGGLVFPDVEWVEDVCEETGAGGAFDVLPIHAYPETWTPEGVTVENYLGEGFRSGFLATADRLCGRKRIWINETGFATIPGKSEIDQAAWWVRAIATFAAEPRVEHIGIYEIKDLAPDRPAIGDAPNYHLGLTRVDRTKKLAFSTVKMMIALLGQQPFSVVPHDIRPRGGHGDLHRRVFVRGDGSAVIVVWNRTADDRVTITLPRAGRLLEHALDGETRPLDAPDVLFEITLKKGIPRIFELP